MNSSYNKEEKNKIKQKHLVKILIALLIIATGYIVYDKWNESRERQRLDVYQQGLNNGYTQAVTQIILQAVTCNQVPLVINNQTINMIAVDCLQAQ